MPIQHEPDPPMIDDNPNVLLAQSDDEEDSHPIADRDTSSSETSSDDDGPINMINQHDPSQYGDPISRLNLESTSLRLSILLRQMKATNKQKKAFLTFMSNVNQTELPESVYQMEKNEQDALKDVILVSVFIIDW